MATDIAIENKKERLKKGGRFNWLVAAASNE